jgi:hypothetical protein
MDSHRDVETTVAAGGTTTTRTLAIGVMGASGGDLTDEVRQVAYRLGVAIARRGAFLGLACGDDQGSTCRRHSGDAWDTKGAGSWEGSA